MAALLFSLPLGSSSAAAIGSAKPKCSSHVPTHASSSSRASSRGSLKTTVVASEQRAADESKGQSGQCAPSKPLISNASNFSVLFLDALLFSGFTFVHQADRVASRNNTEKFD